MAPDQIRDGDRTNPLANLCVFYCWLTLALREDGQEVGTSLQFGCDPCRSSS